MATDWIKKKVRYCVRRYKTRDPYRLAEALGILVFRCALGNCQGCYMYIKRRRIVFLNQDLDEATERMVLAHEIGHAILHPRQNCYFLRDKTLLLPGIEREANLFAAELLIPDETIFEAIGREYTIRQLARMAGCYEGLAKLRLEHTNLNGQ